MTKGLLKKFITLKCQGNPVSCYGKRSHDKLNLETITTSHAFKNLNVSDKNHKFLAKLAKNCDLGYGDGCAKLFTIM